jgi:hypothetical protein
MITEYLPDRNVRHSIVDDDVNLHLIERENRRVRLALVARNQNTRVRQQRASHAENHE